MLLFVLMIKCGELIPRFVSRPNTISLLFVSCIVLSVMCVIVVVESDVFVLSSLHLLKMGERENCATASAHARGMRRHARPRRAKCVDRRSAEIM